MRPSAALFAIAALTACVGEATRGAVTAAPWAVEMPPDARAVLLGAVALTSAEGAFGGFSGLEVSADGARIVAISDAAHWLEAGLARRGGRIVGLSDPTLRPMLPDDAAPRRRDAESLAMADLDGPRAVGFERAHRLSRFDPSGTAESPLPAAIDFAGWSANSGLEGLALAPDGRLLALRERPAVNPGPGQAWWIAPDGAAAPVALPRPDDYSVTGADFGPDGALYVVGRAFDWLGGFRFAVWRLRAEGDGFAAAEVLVELKGPGADNAEGIAAWAGPDGDVRLIVITDDNFNLMQRTILYEFSVPPA